MTSRDGVTLDLGGRKAEVVTALGRLNTENLKVEVEETGGQAVWWGILTAQARRLAGIAKLTLDTTEASLNGKLRADAINRGEKPTVDQVTAAIRLHPEYQAAALAHLDAVEKAEIVESAKYAVVQKSKTLEALASMIVEELKARRAPGPYLPQPGRQPVHIQERS